MPPKKLARIAGALYVIVIILGAYGELGIRDRIIGRDPAATLANLRSMESLWRLGIASEYFLLICSTMIAVILYMLLRPAGRNLALLALFFNGVSIAIEAATDLNLVSAIPSGKAAFSELQIAAMSTIAIRAHTNGFGVALMFFGSFLLIAGTLVYRSGYFPRLLGILLQLGGVGYLIDSFGLILFPAMANALFVVLLLPFIGETSFALWLLVKGVNVEKFAQ